MLLLILMLGVTSAVMPEVPVQEPAFTTDAFSVLALFMLLALTFSVSLYGMRRLLERSPKKVLHTRLGKDEPERLHEVIVF